MPEKNPIDIQKVIEQGAKVTSLQDLQHQGVQKVKVLDEATIQNLIAQAVDRVVNAQTAEERTRIAAQSRTELDRLMREHREMKTRAQLLETSKNELIERVESLQKELSMALDVQQDTIHKKVEKITAALRKHAAEASERAQAAQKALADSCVEIDRLKADQARISRELGEARRAGDDLRRRLQEEQARAKGLEDARAALEARQKQAAGEIESLRSSLRDQERAESELAALRRELERERGKASQAEFRLSSLQREAKETEERLQADLRQARQAKEDYDRLNSQNIRLMGEVQSLRSEIARLRSGGAAAPEKGPAPALAQLGAGKSSPAGKWKFLVRKIPPPPAGEGGTASASIELPEGGDWDLVTVAREPDGSCLCFFRAPR